VSDFIPPCFDFDEIKEDSPMNFVVLNTNDPTTIQSLPHFFLFLHFSTEFSPNDFGEKFAFCSGANLFDFNLVSQLIFYL